MLHMIHIDASIFRLSMIDYFMHRIKSVGRVWESYTVAVSGLHKEVSY